MSHNRKTEEDQERAALYALGLMCQHEARAFEDELRNGDPQLQSDLQSFEKVVDAIGYGAPAADPPSYILDILLTRLDKEEQLSPPAKVLPLPERSSAASPPVDRAQQPPSSPLVESIQNRKPSSAAALLPWAIAASLVVCAVAAFFAWRQARQESEALRAQINVIQDQADQLRQEVKAENEKVLELARINQVLSSPDHWVIEMSGAEGAPNSSAKIYWDTRARQWVVMAQLPPAPAGKVYQLWFVTADAKISAGLINPKDDGHAFTVVNVPQDVNNIAAAAITLEPEGGSPQPTMPIFTLGKVS